MAHSLSQLKEQLRATPQRWLITGVAGFIGSHLLEALLNLGQEVVGLDNFSTIDGNNLNHVKMAVGEERWGRFVFVEGDIRHLDDCRRVCQSVDIVLHQAALGSVPRSIENPLATHESNIDGFLNMLIAAKDAGISRFVYAASSSTYGDHPGLPKVESVIGRPLSPYAVTKYVNELYANVFDRSYHFKATGLRYFNVFGPRQNPAGAYAAVIPKWFAGLLDGGPIHINGDGETSRDFCFIENVIQANLLAATTDNPAAQGEIYNVAFGQSTSLNRLFEMIRTLVARVHPHCQDITPIYRPFRPGDVRHSLASIEKAQSLLNYAPEFDVQQGLAIAADWYLQTHRGTP